MTQNKPTLTFSASQIDQKIINKFIKEIKETTEELRSHTRFDPETGEPYPAIAESILEQVESYAAFFAVFTGRMPIIVDYGDGSIDIYFNSSKRNLSFLINVNSVSTNFYGDALIYEQGEKQRIAYVRSHNISAGLLDRKLT